MSHVKFLRQPGDPRGGRGVTLRFSAVLLWVLMAGLPASFTLTARERARHPAEQQPAPPFKVEIDFVHVDVTVTDKAGRFVADLEREDFEVYEDGKRQQVSTFTLVDIPVHRAPRAAAPAPSPLEPDVRSNHLDTGGRVYVIVLDDLHVDPLRSAKVKQAARQFIEQHVMPNDLVAVAHTSGRPEASQEFTTRPSLLLQAVDKFVGRKLRSRVLEGLREYERRREESSRADVRLNRATDPLELQRVDQAQRMLKTLASLGDVLSRARGRRKAVVLISEGVDYPLEQGITQTSSGSAAFTSVYAPDVLRRLQDAIQAAARANVSIYAIDPRGLAGTGDDAIEVSSFPENPHLGLTPVAFEDERRQAQNSLRILSERTGGLASVGSNDFSDAFDRIVNDNSTYYMLGYQSNEKQRAGRYRSIEVRIKRSDLRVRARSGYATTPRDKAERGFLTPSVEPSAALREALSAPLPVTGLPLRVFAAPFRHVKEAAVSVGIEIDGRRFRLGQKDGAYTGTLEVALAALDEEGRFKGGDRHTVHLQLKPETYKAVQVHGLRVLFRLMLPPGRFQLRAAAHEAASGLVGSVFYDLEIPDFHTTPLAISGLVLTAPSAAQIPTARMDPLFQRVLPSPPTGARAFQVDETLGAFFEIYRSGQLGAAVVDLTTTVKGIDGQVHFRSDGQVAGEQRGNAGVSYSVQVPLADLAPGLYVLRIEARGRTLSQHVALREVPFELVTSNQDAR